MKENLLRISMFILKYFAIRSERLPSCFTNSMSFSVICRKNGRYSIDLQASRLGLPGGPAPLPPVPGTSFRAPRTECVLISWFGNPARAQRLRVEDDTDRAIGATQRRAAQSNHR